MDELNQKDKKEYEIAYLARTEADAAAIVALVKAEGDIKEDRPAGKLKLAYEIEKETEAFFGVLRGMLEPSVAKRLEETLRMDKRVLRSMIINYIVKGKKKGTGEPRAEGTAPRAARPATARPGEPRPVALSNEALEKKIEEILQ